MRRDRRRCCALVAATAAGCALGEAPPSWETRLRGDTLALLGEVHDNAEGHRRRAASLRRAVEAGWRPAVVMEQFDADRQADIDRSRRERPDDASHLIAQASPGRSGWDWALYRPVIELALVHDLPLVAGNLPRAEATRLVREPFDAVLGRERATRLGLDAPLDAAWQAAQEREIDAGHCGTLPRTLWPGMARAQAARDAQLAQALRAHASRGAVLLAGNGHVRRDLGVPRWLSGAAADRVLAVGYVEEGTAPTGPQQYDALVVTPPRGARRSLRAAARSHAVAVARHDGGPQSHGAMEPWSHEERREHCLLSWCSSSVPLCLCGCGCFALRGKVKYLNDTRLRRAGRSRKPQSHRVTETQRLRERKRRTACCCPALRGCVFVHSCAALRNVSTTGRRSTSRRPHQPAASASAAPATPPTSGTTGEAFQVNSNA
jgi:uncharacterized iron-regulated protein